MGTKSARGSSKYAYTAPFYILVCILFVLVVSYNIRYHKLIYEPPVSIPPGLLDAKRSTVAAQALRKPDAPPANQTITFHQFRRYTLPDYKKAIPPDIFRTSPYGFDELPPGIQIALQSTLRQSPSFTQIYLDNKDCDAVVSEFYPQYIPAYLSLRPGAFKADLVRLILLHEFGGLYSDIGHAYQKPVPEWLRKDDECVLVREISFGPWGVDHGLHNAFMAGYKGHPFFGHAIDFIAARVSQRYYGWNPLDISGPRALKEALGHFAQLGKIARLPEGELETAGGHRFRIFSLQNDLAIVATPEVYIYDGDTAIIRCKFENYYQVVYRSRNSFHYHELWFARMVYNEVLTEKRT
jgi:mannosyltransferase OCH1-like enzyme